MNITKEQREAFSAARKTVKWFNRIIKVGDRFKMRIKNREGIEKDTEMLVVSVGAVVKKQYAVAYCAEVHTWQRINKDVRAVRCEAIVAMVQEAKVWEKRGEAHWDSIEEEEV